MDNLEIGEEFGAGNETRTRDPDLGKVVLYQLSYSRKFATTFVAVVTRNSLSLREAHYTRNPFSCNPPGSDFYKITLK